MIMINQRLHDIIPLLPTPPSLLGKSNEYPRQSPRCPELSKSIRYRQPREQDLHGRALAQCLSEGKGFGQEFRIVRNIMTTEGAVG